MLYVPLRFSWGDHGIYNNLGAIGEVTKLSLPNCEGIRMRLSISILVSKDCILRKMRVADLETLYLCIWNDWWHGNIRLISFLIEDNSVSVRECSTLNILTGHSNVETFVNQGSEGKGFGSAPVDALSVLNWFTTSLENLLHSWVEIPIVGKSCNF
jgi:hypothetical protein